MRQKARWIHGIAFQGWERLGWSRGWAETWMRLRDRRGPLTALVLLAGYLVVVIWAITGAAASLGVIEQARLGNLLSAVVLVGAVGLVWRALMRFAFTTIQYGRLEGFRAIFRLPIANIVTIVAARRALTAYVRSLRGHEPVWDKTDHYRYTPPIAAAASASA